MKRVIIILLLVFFLSNCMSFAENAKDTLSNLYSEAELLMAQGDYFGAADKFDNMGAYSDASQMAMYCKAIGLAEENNMYEIAIETFNNLGDFKDSKQMAKYYAGRTYQYLAESYDIESISVDDLNKVNNYYEKARDIYSALALFKDCMTRFTTCQRGCDAVINEIDKRKNEDIENTYLLAIELKQAEKYDEAINYFSSILEYKDSSEQIKDCTYHKAIKIEKEKKYNEAIEIFKSVIDYEDSKTHIALCEYGIQEDIYQKAEKLKKDKQYYDAIQVYKTIIDFSDSKDKIEKCTEAIYKRASNLEKNYHLDKAVNEYLSIADYKDSAERIKKCKEQYRKIHRLHKIHKEGVQYISGSNPISTTTDIIYYYYKGNKAKAETTYVWNGKKSVSTENIIISDDGSFISGSRKDDDGSTFDIEYDKNNNVIKRVQNYRLDDGRKQTIIRKYEYNKYGDVIKEDFYRDGKIEERSNYKYTYNDDGSVIQERTYVSMNDKETVHKGETMKWIYEFDSMGLPLHKKEIPIEGNATEYDIYYEYQ